jgi:RND family efflux transporter MFP subunit
MKTARHLVGLALGVVIGALACAAPVEPGPKKPVPVRVRAIEKGSGGLEARYSGTLEPSRRVDMAFRVGGYVEALAEVKTADGRRRPIDQGDSIAKGAFLARLRSADYSQKLATAKATVAEAAAAAKLAEQDFARATALFAGKVISEAELDTTRARLDSAKATVAGATARMNEASLALVDTTLSAPLDGVVLSRSIEVGSLVAPGSAAFAIADTRSVKAVFGAPQQLVERLRIGSPLTVYLGPEGTAGGKAVAAQVTRIAPAAEAASRVFSVEASLPNDEGTLRPGSVVAVRVPEAALDAPSLVVPLSAVVRSPRDPKTFAVFLLDGPGERARVRLKDVQLGDVRGNGASVIEGLALGDRVVTVGATLLSDGDDAVVLR